MKIIKKCPGTGPAERGAGGALAPPHFLPSIVSFSSFFFSFLNYAIIDLETTLYHSVHDCESIERVLYTISSMVTWQFSIGTF